ncbi:MAG: hypothetical protein AB1705_26140, partial [Verrucomicrobiota bacterium]
MKSKPPGSLSWSKLKRLSAIAVVVAACLVAGCIPSLNPLYTEKDTVFDAALVGQWSEKGKETESWTFAKGEGKAYALTIRDEEKSSPFQAHLVQLGEFRFLDIYPDEDGLDDLPREAFFKASLIPGHLVLRVYQVEPELKLCLPDPKEL